MTIVQTEDNRNQEWRKGNVGSRMLEKMGWTEGKGIGKRNVNTTALRAVKRQEGLGIGAKRQTEGGPSESTGTFAAVLANLKAHHGTANGSSSSSSDDDDDDQKKSKKKSSKKKEEGESKSKSEIQAVGQEGIEFATKQSISGTRTENESVEIRSQECPRFGLYIRQYGSGCDGNDWCILQYYY